MAARKPLVVIGGAAQELPGADSITIPLSWISTSGATAGYVIKYLGGVITWAPDNDSGGGGGGISDAPADGKYYERRNNAWESRGQVRPAISLPHIFTSTVANWSNYTIFIKLSGLQLLMYPDVWNFKLAAALPSAGSLFIGAIKVLETNLGSTTVLSSTTVTIGGSPTPTLSATTTVSPFQVDNIALPLRNDRDYWVAMYFTSSSNPSLGQVTNASYGSVTSNYAVGNQTGVTTIPVAANNNITGLYDFRAVP